MCDSITDKKKMPKGQVFGNRVVVKTGDYKHIQKFKNEVNQREEALGQVSHQL